MKKIILTLLTLLMLINPCISATTGFENTSKNILSTDIYSGASSTEKREAVLEQQSFKSALQNVMVIHGIATGGTNTSLVDSNANLNMSLVGATLIITSPSKTEQVITQITANTQTTLTFASGYTPLAGDTYNIIQNKISSTSVGNLDGNGNLLVSLGTGISSSTDNIDINKMSAGGLITAHSAITATTTSAEIDCRGFNSVRIEVETTNVSSTDKVWTPTITGSCVSGGTFGQIFQNVAGTQTALVLPAISYSAGNIKQIYVIQGGIPSFLKITETLSGTNGTSAITVKVIPFNV